MTEAVKNLLYLLAVVLFILGLKGLSHPKTAVRGNILGAIGMFIAVITTIVAERIVSFEWIIVGIVLGAIIGSTLAIRIKMTAMPQLVALFNGLGGVSSVLVASNSLLISGMFMSRTNELLFFVAIAISAMVGAVTFWGSLVAFGKLQGLISEKPVRYPGEQFIKIILFLIILFLAFLFTQGQSTVQTFWILAGISSLLGILLVISIGGADMPIVIALLNSYSGIAASATGFVLNNLVLIVAGSLVGASGIILTRVMCKAMNRSLANVLFGGVGAVQDLVQDDIYEGKIKSTSAEEVAMLLSTARRVVIVPGYGMAVAGAQSAVRALTELLEKNDITVEFGIHPVAGRMPGHMNVLLAEENISYEKLKDLDQINNSFHNTDVSIVLGANDVVNPLARESSGTPVSGMPILNVDKSRTVIVIKRSLSPGFAGIPNPLFAMENTLMLFGDGKEVIETLVSEYKAL